MTAAAAAHFNPTRPAPHPPAQRSLLFNLWEQADQLVPFPFLYFWLARPHPGRPAAKLHHLCHLDYIYGITGNFIAHLSCKDGAFSRAIIHRESFGFRLMPFQGRQELITPEAAERAIERYPLLQQLEFWEIFYEETGLGGDKVVELEIELLFERYRQLPWHSLRLERPLRAGAMEPIYRFRKAGTRCEFIVGARTGRVRHEHVPDPPPPQPPDPIPH